MAHIGRRAFLGLLTAVPAAEALAYSEHAQSRPAPEGAERLGYARLRSAQTTDSNDVLEQLAYGLDVAVPRQQLGGHKWGWHLKIQELCQDARHGQYLITVENEDWPQAPGGPDPRRLLTTIMNVREDVGFQVAWNRNDRLTRLVADNADDNAIRVFSTWNPTIELDNVGHHARSPAQMEKNFPVASGLGIRLENILSVQTHEWEQWEMHNWLRGESDPWSVLTIKSVGKSAHRDERNSLQDHHNVYELKLYRRGTDGNKNRILTARLDFSNGILQRVDEASNIGGPYSKIYAWLPGSMGQSGNVVPDENGVLEYKLFGIDNQSVSRSVLDIPRLRTVRYVGIS